MHATGDRRADFRCDSDYNQPKYIISFSLFIKSFFSIFIGVVIVGVNNEEVAAVVVCDVVVVVVVAVVKQIIQ
jgi:hypothetical protein